MGVRGMKPHRSIRRDSRSHGCGRRGLAPLELVLVLPLLLFIMGMMVNYATSASWKVRTLTAARQAMWRARMNYWHGGSDRHLPDWPQEGRLSMSNGPDISSVMSRWLRPEIDKTFLKGPVITNEGPYPQAGGNGEARIGVLRRENIRMDRGLFIGRANLSRDMPLLKGLRLTQTERQRLPDVNGAPARGLGRFSYNLSHPLVDNRWQFSNMGYGSNWARRLNGWYEVRNDGAWASEQDEFRAAEQTLTSYPARELLAVLDRDEELTQFFGGRPDQCFRGIASCTAYTRQEYAMIELPGIIAGIQGPRGGGQGGFPSCLAGRFLQMYQQQLRIAQAQMPPDFATIARVTPLIQQLQQFMGTLN